MSVFVYAQGVKTVHAGGGGLKNGKILSMQFLNAPLRLLFSHCVDWRYVLVFFKKSHPPRLFQPPRLIIQELLHPLHVFSSLLGYQRDESSRSSDFPLHIKNNFTSFKHNQSYIFQAAPVYKKNIDLLFQDEYLKNFVIW